MFSNILLQVNNCPKLSLVWVVFTKFGWFWVVLCGLGYLWVDLGGFGWFWVVLGSFGWLWVVLVGFGWFWRVACFITNAISCKSERRKMVLHVPEDSIS